MLPDYSKSMKHYWNEATFIPDLEDGAAAWNVASRFLELRVDDFVGGFRTATLRAVHLRRSTYVVGRRRVRPDRTGIPTARTIPRRPRSTWPRSHR
nr:ATP-grasp domain-containing protein [Micromonospora tarensis]